MRGRSSLAVERLQSDYRSCPGKAGGSLFGSRSSDWPTWTLFAREPELYPKHLIRVGTLVARYPDDFIIWRPARQHTVCHMQ